ncbi:Crp/Fnr family transcriptional regulator [Thalassotalea mangrovi]|uniref:Cyclic nucleotide-binding domain-containing protein n=1 Tax=Thalassotalea mangrovi TaxID=2572245 RepID=A0A4U1B1N6_9GAMM|nr:helix-turn-helix domain-containing protein [Thalassotalea mangrovi]TKB43257.1 cyclic nucleotide-binding domain-containing protein [Thalassotalea mangrovi]
MPLDLEKVGVKTALRSFLGSNDLDTNTLAEFYQDLSRNSEEIRYSPGQHLFREGDLNEYIYIPVSGAIMLERSTSSGSRQVFAFLLTGNILGVSDQLIYNFSAKALNDSNVIKISQKLMKNIFERYPAIAKRYQQITSHILSMILDQLFIMGQRTAHQRLAHLLLDMQNRLGHGTNKFHLPMSRQDIADYLGMSLETTSRGFSQLKKLDLINIENNYQITIVERVKLTDYANR